MEKIRHSALSLLFRHAGFGMVIDGHVGKAKALLGFTRRHKWEGRKCLRRTSGLCRSGRKGRCTRFGLVAAREEKRRLTLCLDAIPDGKPLRTFPRIARTWLKDSGAWLNGCRSPSSSAVHQRGGIAAAEKALKWVFELPK
ncbi:hypothetical protein FJ987_01440 [Mesorhizobium sp. CU2]|uniref:hypothetical protein n=1 Tax=unclassified Mesorhizobium TaxID=325217 RepID=UPI00112CC4B5|nr:MULTISPECIES: hypothetical protein [unclassified Mesorhizobium]TPN80563.1 hypothetical protein FJ988_20985 [Mesorhizobium sp. CU3]TPO21936.1 hypothetical protein FJ987_01440 [Mesorhizobium sp. CU2]